MLMGVVVVVEVVGGVVRPCFNSIDNIKLYEDIKAVVEIMTYICV